MKAHLRIASESTPCNHRKQRAVDPHLCPFQSTIHGDLSDFCLCCESCEADCQRDADKLMPVGPTKRKLWSEYSSSPAGLEEYALYEKATGTVPDSITPPIKEKP